MSVVISDNLVLNPTTDFDANNPIIGWHNLVELSSVTTGDPIDDSEVENSNYPTGNLANPSSYLRFQQSDAEQNFYIQTTLPGTSLVDYVAIAGHNFGSIYRAVQVFGATTLDAYGEFAFEELTQETIPPDNSPLLFRFKPDYYLALRVVVRSTIGGNNDIGRAAVLYAGKLLVLERKIQVSFVPINYGRRVEVQSHRSERGAFLGRTLTGAWVETSANIMYLSPDWYRTYMEPFMKVSTTRPFFFAWAPLSYPREVGYVWLMDNAEPVIHLTTGHMQVNLLMQGIVE